MGTIVAGMVDMMIVPQGVAMMTGKVATMTAAKVMATGIAVMMIEKTIQMVVLLRVEATHARIAVMETRVVTKVLIMMVADTKHQHLVEVIPASAARVVTEVLMMMVADT